MNSADEEKKPNTDETTNMLYLGANAAAVAVIAANTRVSAQGSELTATTDLGPFYEKNGIGVTNGDFSTQRVTGFNLGFASERKEEDSSIGRHGFSEEKQTQSSFLGVHESEKHGLKINSHGISANGHYEIAGHTLVDYDVNSSCCCGPIAQFFSWAWKGIKSLFTNTSLPRVHMPEIHMPSVHLPRLPSIDWGKVGSGIVKGVVAVVEVAGEVLKK